MAFTKINAAGIGSTETVTLDGLTVINDGSFGGNVSVGGTLTYEDVTNIDSVGLITARAGVVVGSGITLSKDGDIFATGVTTATSFVGDGSQLTGVASTENIRTNTNATFLQNVNVSGTTTAAGNINVSGANITLGDSGGASDDRIVFGAGSDLSIYHDGGNNRIKSGNAGTNDLKITNTGNFVVETSDSENLLRGIKNGQVDLYYNGTKRFETTNDGTVTTGIATATTFVPTESQLSQRNLIINGAMRVAQRATSYTGGYGTSNINQYYKTVDRILITGSGLPNTDVTTAQHALTSSDTGPYELGFRYAMQVQMGYQGSVPSDVIVGMQYRMEAQDIAGSGWNYTSSSSYITLSFWAKSTVSQTFYGLFRTLDGTQYKYPFSYALTANTWKKVIVTVPGNSNLTINNDTGEGLRINLSPYLGTDSTSSGVTLNTWSTHSNSAKTPDQTSTWYSTNGATFEVTGLQLEVGSVATPFEHISYQQDFLRCCRYFWKSVGRPTAAARGAGSSAYLASLATPVPLRAEPTIASGTDSNNGSFNIRVYEYDGTSDSSNTPTVGTRGWTAGNTHVTIYQTGHSVVDDRVITIYQTGGYLDFGSEL